MAQPPLHPCDSHQYDREDSWCEDCTSICSKPFANWESDAKNKCQSICSTTNKYTFDLTSTNTPSSTSVYNWGLIIGVTFAIVFIVIVIVIVIVIKIKFIITCENWLNPRSWTPRNERNRPANFELTITTNTEASGDRTNTRTKRNGKKRTTNNEIVLEDVHQDNQNNAAEQPLLLTETSSHNEYEPTNPTTTDISTPDVLTTIIPTPSIPTTDISTPDILTTIIPTPSIPTTDIPTPSIPTPDIGTPIIPTLESDGLTTASPDRSNDPKAGDSQLEPSTVDSSGDIAVMETDESATASNNETTPAMETAIADENIKQIEDPTTPDISNDLKDDPEWL